MKILSLTYEYPPIGGGGSVVASALNETLVRFGDEVEVVTSAMPGLHRVQTVNGVRIRRSACWRRHAHYTNTPELATTLVPAYLEAARVLREFRPDLVHAHFVIPTGVVATALCRRYDLPLVLTAHGSDIPGYNPDRFRVMHELLRPAWRRIIAGAAAVTSPSRFLADLINESSPVPVTVIPNGYAPAPRQHRAKRNLVLLVARMFPRKGVQHFLESLCGLDSDWEFVVAGDGPYLSELKQQATRLGSPVRFAGFVDRITLRSLYEEARILVFPSLRENFPMVLMEAMDAGCAIVTTDAEGCAEVVGDAGIVIERGSPSQIREALARLTHDDLACEELAARARARVRTLRWPVVAQRFRCLFADVLGQQAPELDYAGDLTATGVFTAPFSADGEALPHEAG